VKVGYVPLVDAAPLIVAQEMGFAAEEGISLDLVAAPSWSSVRDMLAFGQVDAAHLLSPMPVASALGLGGAGTMLEAVSVMSVNGNVVGVSREIETRLRDQGYAFDFNCARTAGQALIKAAGKPLRIGVPFPFSMHAELLYYWLNALGVPAPQSVTIKTVPPALMAEAIRAGEIDAFCVGEPWGSIAVENGVGALLLPGRAIWSFAPEKVLATRAGWADAEPALSGRLIRAVWRAGRWLAEAESKIVATELLSRSAYLNLPGEILDRALTGHFVVNSQGDQRKVEAFVGFHRGLATFPWRSQSQWIAYRLAARTGLDRTEAMRRGFSVFRSDVHRDALADTGADLPGASSKIEGSVDREMAVASESGKLFLTHNQFFDRRVFDPNDPE
jgi:NitT/TauT family transport system ATP-binding protein